MLKSDVFTSREVFKKRTDYLTDCGCCILARFEKKFVYDDGIVTFLFVLVWEE